MNWKTLFSRMMDLAGMQNIPCIQTYADAWAELAADLQAIGLPETAKNCQARADQYRILPPGEYVRLIEQPMAELIQVSQ